MSGVSPKMPTKFIDENEIEEFERNLPSAMRSRPKIPRTPAGEETRT